MPPLDIMSPIRMKKGTARKGKESTAANMRCGIVVMGSGEAEKKIAAAPAAAKAKEIGTAMTARRKKSEKNMVLMRLPPDVMQFPYLAVAEWQQERDHLWPA